MHGIHGQSLHQTKIWWQRRWKTRGHRLFAADGLGDTNYLHIVPIWFHWLAYYHAPCNLVKFIVEVVLLIQDFEGDCIKFPYNLIWNGACYSFSLLHELDKARPHYWGMTHLHHQKPECLFKFSTDCSLTIYAFTHIPDQVQRVSCLF